MGFYPTVHSQKKKMTDQAKKNRFNIKYSQNSNENRVVEAFWGLPGPNARLFVGLQATELNHLTRHFKMDLQLTNHRFNFDKCRVSMRVTIKRSEGRARMTWIGVSYLMKAG